MSTFNSKRINFIILIIVYLICILLPSFPVLVYTIEEETPKEQKFRHDYKFTFKKPYYYNNTVPFFDTYGPDALLAPDFIRLAPSVPKHSGSIWSQYANTYKDWMIELSFRISGNYFLGDQHSYFTTRSEIIGEEIDDEAKIHDVNLLMQNVELQDLNQEFILPNFQPPSRGLGEIEFFQPAAELSLKKLDFTLVLNEWNLCWASVISVIGIKDNITAKDKLTDVLVLSNLFFQHVEEVFIEELLLAHEVLPEDELFDLEAKMQLSGPKVLGTLLTKENLPNICSKKKQKEVIIENVPTDREEVAIK
ncbi:16008_t:CDS:2 [Entrophospora sp. SA101]|nr:16008_t:CDS:2 [Entrophospora sp. SA101]